MYGGGRLVVTTVPDAPDPGPHPGTEGGRRLGRDHRTGFDGSPELAPTGRNASVPFGDAWRWEARPPSAG